MKISWRFLLLQASILWSQPAIRFTIQEVRRRSTCCGERCNKKGAPARAHHFFSLLNARIICSAACFWSTVRLTQLSNNSLSSGDNSTISLSQKNCESVIPNPLQIASNVEIEGIVFLLKMLANVDSERPHSLERRYSVQLCSASSSLSLVCISKAHLFLYPVYP